MALGDSSTQQQKERKGEISYIVWTVCIEKYCHIVPSEMIHSKHNIG